MIIMNTYYGHSDGKRNPTCLWRHLLADRELCFCTISELNGFKVLEVVAFLINIDQNQSNNLSKVKLNIPQVLYPHLSIALAQLLL